MPRPGTRFAGIRFRLPPAVVAGVAATAALSACSVLEAQPAATPTPTAPASAPAAGGGSWVEDLTFSGQLKGRLSQVSAAQDTLRSACSGRRGSGTGSWVMTLYGPIGQIEYGLQVAVSGYRGPGDYAAPQVDVQVFAPDSSTGWRVSPGDPADLQVGPDEQSGTVQATLTNLADNSGKVTVQGRWSCAT